MISVGGYRLRVIVAGHGLAENSHLGEVSIDLVRITLVETECSVVPALITDANILQRASSE